jgi:hypothetical protein
VVEPRRGPFVPSGFTAEALTVAPLVVVPFATMPETIRGFTVTMEEADLLVSAWLIALTVTVLGLGTALGAE